MRTKTIDNSQDIIDSRDIIARIEELQDQADYAQAQIEEGEEPTLPLDEDEAEELKTLLALQSEATGYCSDWIHGEALIRETYFEDYAQELAEDLGSVSKNQPWPLNHIDWTAAAEELKRDYTEVDFDGVAYLVR